MSSFTTINFYLIFFLLVNRQFCELVCVVDINRHGDRTPKQFPKFSARLFYSSNQNSLTIVGLRQSTLLGRWFYERYIEDKKFLSEEYNKEEVQFRTSPVTRNLMSEAGFIQGMYPRYITKPIFNIEKSNLRNDQVPPIHNFKLKKRNFKEIPIYIESSINDNIIHPIKCKLNKSSKKTILDELFVNSRIYPVLEGQELKDVIDDIKTQVPYIFQGLTDKEIYNFGFFDELNKFVTVIEAKLIKKYNFKEKTRKALRGQAIQRLYYFRLVDSRGERLACSGLFDTILNYFEERIKNPKAYKFVSIAAHDTTIMPLLSNLLQRAYLEKLLKDAENSDELTNYLIPEVASSFIVELHKQVDIYFVKIYYNGVQLKENLVSQLKYNSHLEGFTYESIKSYFRERIDDAYKTLYCNLADEIDYTKVPETEINKTSFKDPKRSIRGIDNNKNLDVNGLP